jgi:hypothetical protein
MMQASITQQQTPQDYVLDKIKHVYAHNQKLHLAKRHQVALRHRKRLVRARALFRQELDKALQPRTQQGLGIIISLDDRHLSQPGFIAHFEFEGKCWILAFQRRSWHCEWFFKRADQTLVTRCSSSSLEMELCYALGQYHQQSQAA